jgi:hypothetical protein
VIQTAVDIPLDQVIMTIHPDQARALGPAQTADRDLDLTAMTIITVASRRSRFEHGS